MDRQGFGCSLSIQYPRSFHVGNNTTSMDGIMRLLGRRLLDHFIRLNQNVLWYHKTKLLGCLEVHKNLKFGRKLHW
jgi:hypothetical protein